MTKLAMIYCRRLRAKMSRVACERRKSVSYRETGGNECRGCPGPEPLGDVDLEEMMVNVKGPKPAEDRGMCVECGLRPWNPRYRKIKKCSACVAKTRKTKPGPKPKRRVEEAYHQKTTGKGWEICKMLEEAGVPYQVEVKISILPEGRPS